MHNNFLIPFILGLSGLACNVLFSLDSIIRAGKHVNLQKYFSFKKYSILLTFILIIQAAYFREMYMAFVLKMLPDIDGYALVGFWLLGLFSQPVMSKIMKTGNDKFA